MHLTARHNRVLTVSRVRSQRKAVPSPLQTMTSATSPPTSVTPTRSTFPRSGTNNPSYSASHQEQPRSPKERLDDLLASERSFYRSEDSSVDSIRAETSRYFEPFDFLVYILKYSTDPLVPFKNHMVHHEACPILSLIQSHRVARRHPKRAHDHQWRLQHRNIELI